MTKPIIGVKMFCKLLYDVIQGFLALKFLVTHTYNHVAASTFLWPGCFVY